MNELYSRITKLNEGYTYKSLFSDLQKYVSNYQNLELKSNSPISGYSIIGGKNKLMFDFRTRNFTGSFGILFFGNKFSINFKDKIISEMGLKENNGILEVTDSDKDKLFKEMADFCNLNRSDKDTARERVIEFAKNYLDDKDIYFKRELFDYLGNKLGG